MPFAELREEAVLADTQPLYRRLLASIRADISEGTLQPGDVIPPEVEIARRQGISRHTVRQAIVELAREGWLRRERGRGTFVQQRPLAHSPGTNYSFAHEMRERGLAYETRLLHREVRAASLPIAERLALQVGAPVVEMELLRMVEGSPLILEFLQTPYDLMPSLATVELRDDSLYDVIAARHGIQITFGREEIRPVVLDRRQARLLGVVTGSPAFHVDRRAMAGSTPIELRRRLIRGDRYLYRVELPVPS